MSPLRGAWMAACIAVAVGGNARAQQRPRCEAVITEAATRRVWQAVHDATGIGACQVASVRASPDHIEILWSASGSELPSMRVDATTCVPGARRDAELVVTTPADLAARCGAQCARVQRAIEGVEGLQAGPVDTYSRRTAMMTWALALVMLVVLSVGVVRATRRSDAED